MAVIYLAHPYAAATEEEMERNRRNAMAWGIWIAQTFGFAVSADWLWWTEFLKESPANRELGLSCDDQSIVKCDEFWMVGGRISDGMARGRQVAEDAGIEVRSLIQWGYPAPGYQRLRPGAPSQVLDIAAVLRRKGLITL